MDILRGISILLVLIHHFHLTYRMDHGFFADILSAEFMRRLGRNGNYGVTIFFVISGFLITSTTLSRFGELSRVSLRSFYSFRFARIIPSLALMLGAVVSLGWAGLEIFQNDKAMPSLAVTVLSVLTFTHNVLMEKFGWFNYCLNTLWSLSVEEVFYLAFPILCISLRKRAVILSVLALFALIGPIFRAQHLENDIVAMHGYLSCFDSIAIGCIAAILGSGKSLSKTGSRIVTAIAAVTITAVYFYKGIYANAVIGISLVSLSTAAILLSRTTEPIRWQILDRPLGVIRWFGKNSYELYLFHIIVLAIMRTVLKHEDTSYAVKPLWFATFLLVSAVIAELIARFYSEPLNRKLRQSACSGSKDS